jgi:hypothetical protein
VHAPNPDLTPNGQPTQGPPEGKDLAAAYYQHLIQHSAWAELAAEALIILCRAYKWLGCTPLYQKSQHLSIPTNSDIKGLDGADRYVVLSILPKLM